MNNPNLQELSTKIYESNKAKGWWDLPRPRVQTAWLVVTELAEATEAERAGRYAKADLANQESRDGTKEGGMDYDAAFAHGFRIHIKDSFEDEIADAVIRLLDLAGSEKAMLAFLETNPIDIADTSNEEIFFTIASWLFDDYDGKAIYNSICLLAELSEKQGFDLWMHVELKLQYNATRPRMHGGKRF